MEAYDSAWRVQNILGMNLYCTTTGTYSYSQMDARAVRAACPVNMTTSTFARLADSFLATHSVPLSTALPHTRTEV